ncbi:MAG: SDR family NAD(P)-dependent oxidoreductase [Verrucomicrobiota bacterium]|nr:SDR family NAD(P)-dependent oxidoreductase [Verrucomicrobiota bacterium]
MSTLNGKVAVVTGASSGIGHSIAEALLDRGARVFGLCRKIGRIPEAATPVSCDVRDPRRIAHAFEVLKAATPTVDILVNNAGIAYLSSLLEGPVEEWDEMWEVNVRAVAICTKHALPMMPGEGGRIVNVSSLSGHRVPPTGGFYAPTKFAVKGLTESLRNELKAANLPHQIGSVSPGFVDTPLVNTYFRGREEDLSSLRQKTRMLDPEDIARAVLHILEAPPHVEIGDVVLRSGDQKV